MLWRYFRFTSKQGHYKYYVSACGKEDLLLFSAIDRYSENVALQMSGPHYNGICQTVGSNVKYYHQRPIIKDITAC